MKNIKLSNRLRSIVNYVQQGANIIDVGTDHGLIPTYLAQNDVPITSLPQISEMGL